MKIILIFVLIGAVLYAIDMLICKISPKAGYMVAIFNLPFLPVGIVTFILTQKYLEKTLGVSNVTQYFRESGESAKQKKEKRKASANISRKAAEVQANKRIELVIPEGTTEIKEKELENREDIISVVIPKDVTTENRVNEPVIVNEKKEAAPTVALQKTDEGDSKKIKPDKPTKKVSAPIQKAQDDNKVEETKSQAESKPMVNTENTKLTELERKANSGDARTQYYLGKLYKLGDGVPVDDKKMVKYLTAAAKQGYELAQYEMGRLYELGRGVPYDAGKALYWYEKCFEKVNSKPSITDPLKDYSKERIEVLKSKTRVSRKSDTDKREEYEYLFPFEAELKEDGKELLKRNVLLAETGDINAIHHVGVAYFYGYGIKQNREKGLILLQIAAQKGNPCTQYMLGKLYQNGGLVKPDCEKEKKLFEMAAEHGDFDAQYELGVLYKTGIVYQDRTIVPKDTDKAKEWYKKATQDASFCRKDCVRRHISDIENGTDKMHRYYEKNYCDGINAKVHFYDEPERKFIIEMHSLKNLEDNDICVYSLTPKGEKSPKWLVVKVTMAGCMERYFNDKVKATEQRCVIMKKMDYEKTSPMNLFGIVRDLTNILKYNIRIGTESNFYKDNGLLSDKLEAKDFFSIEVDSNSKEPGAEIYLRDKEYFLNSDKETEVTESQTSAETIVNTKKSESVNGKHGKLMFNDPYGKFSHQTSSIKSRAHNANIEIGVQEKDRQPIALTIKVTECACYEKSETVSYFKANYNDLDSRDLPTFVDEMKKLHFLDSYKGKNETYRALIENDIKTITKEQYETLDFDFKVNEKKHEANDKQDKLSEQTSALIIPDGTTEIKEREFNGREDIISVVIPESVKKIGERAFFSCENLEKVTILRGVIDIGANSFAHCTNLYSVVIPDSVTTIGQGAFYHCTKLTSIVIPKSIKEIGDSAFSDCENLNDVTVKSESETRIGQNAFGGCHNLSSVKLHEGVISIGVGAFGKCTNLSTVVIPDSVVWLGDYAFKNCVNLTRVALPKKLNSMGGYVFYGCKNLTSIDIPENIIPVLCSDGSLSGCLALKSFKIPDGVTEIADSMFSNCENLTTVEIPNTVEQIGSHAFSDCKNLEYVKLPSSVKTIGEGAFDGCEKISDNIKRTALSKIPRTVPVATSYNTPYDDPLCDDNYNPDKYNYELRVAGNGQEYYARIN